MSKLEDFSVSLTRSTGPKPSPSPAVKALVDCVAKGKNPGRLTVHPWSRARHAGNLVTPYTLYELKSGPNQGRVLGANVVTYGDIGGSNDVYIASEAPYRADDYFRMIVDTGARTMVSLTQSHESTHARGVRLDLHHLAPGQNISFDHKGLILKKGGVTITCSGEHHFTPSLPKTKPITQRTYHVTGQGKGSHDIHHFICNRWPDNGLPEYNDVLALVEAAASSQQGHKGAIAVNCQYGQGRTNSFIVMDQIAKAMHKQVDQMLPPDADDMARLGMWQQVGELITREPNRVDTKSFINASQRRVMKFQAFEARVIDEFPLQVVAAEIIRLSQKIQQQHQAAAPAPDPQQHFTSQHTSRRDTGNGNGNGRGR